MKGIRDEIKGVRKNEKRRGKGSKNEGIKDQNPKESKMK